MLEVDRGESRYFEDLKLITTRSGVPADAYFTFSYSPILTSGGAVGGLFCSCVDTTKQVQAKRALEQTETELVGVLESMDEAFFSVDKNFILTRVNKNLETVSRIPAEEQIGKNFLGIYFPDESDKQSKYWIAYHKAMKERVHVAFEDYYDGLNLWTAVNVYPQQDGGLAVFFRNINANKKAEAELIRAKEEAERANHLKSAFLANMSHEIRTPLGAMIGFADLLKDPGINAAEKANYIDILHKNGEQLSHVINDILDLSKVETGHINFEYLKINPAQIAHEVVSLLAVVAKDKGLALTLEDDGKAPAYLVADPTRTRQVLTNLVGNALKFTKVGTIKIKLSGFEGRNGEKCCAFEVVDTGVGIHEDAVERLFKVFSQADNSMTRKYGGTGLGLALSRSLARAMGGDVKLLRSSPDLGSSFLFTVESRDARLGLDELGESTKSKAVEAAPLTSDFLNGIRILLVEDSPDNQQLIWRYLSKYGARVEIADNGLDGYNKAMASDHDIVLMDLQMPVMDGYTATGKLRSRGYNRPIIALTAHAMADVRKKCQDVGCNDHLPKPINPGELVRAVAKHVGRV
ncbi:MAG: response regulator, partial [Proteobacteria bacterium]